MTNPTAGLDWFVVSCVPVCVVLCLLTIRLEPSAKRAKLKAWTGYCFAAIFILGGSDTLLTRGFAPRTTTVGTITSLEQHHGKSDHSTFTLTDHVGDRVNLRMDYAGKELQLGEDVQAIWMSYSSKVVRLNVLSGPESGAKITDVVPFEALASIAFGVYFVFFMKRERRRNPTAISVETSRGQTPLDGIVDTKSLLNLNGK